MPSVGELNSTTAGDSTRASVEGRLLCLSTRFNALSVTLYFQCCWVRVEFKVHAVGVGTRCRYVLNAVFVFCLVFSPSGHFILFSLRLFS